jgi:hypothetical protein
MIASNLVRYLNNHLAGAKFSTDLLDALLKRPHDEERMRFLIALNDEIVEDRRILEGLLRQMGVRESALCGAAGRFGSVAGRMKLMWDGWDDGELGLLEALEVISIGLKGNWMLWASLNEIAEQDPLLGGYDFRVFMTRAEEQGRWVEARRVLEVREALIALPG